MIHLQIEAASVKEVSKRVSFVGHCHQEEIVEDDRRNQNMRQNKVKIIKHFHNHCGKCGNFNNNNYQRFISVVAEVLKRIIKKNKLKVLI